MVDAALGFGTNACTINPNGRLINGLAAPLVLNTSGVGGVWWFRGDAGNWVQEGDFASQTSAIEFPDTLNAYLPFMLAVVIAAQYGADIPPVVAQGDLQGRAAFARSYGRRGRFQIDAPFGSGQSQPQAGQAA